MMTEPIDTEFDLTLPLRFDQWTDARRFPEFAAFQLLTGELSSPTVWEIVEARRPDAWRRWQDYLEDRRSTFTCFWRFVTNNRGLDKSIYKDLTARKQQKSIRDVVEAINDAKLLGIPRLMGISEGELATVL